MYYIHTHDVISVFYPLFFSYKISINKNPLENARIDLCKAIACCKDIIKCDEYHKEIQIEQIKTSFNHVQH